jgi:Flp pilus assembly protein TadG
MTARGKATKGSSLLEFTLVGIPLIFVLISVFDTARGLWTYNTMAYAVREATRYATVHGIGCAAPRTCQVNIGQITRVLQSAGVGLDPGAVSVTFTTANGAATTNTIANLLTSTTVWPPASANAVEQNITISAVYPFRSVLAMFWPGAGPAVGGARVFNLSASSTQAIRF